MSKRSPCSVATPAPVATLGSVKSVKPRMLAETGELKQRLLVIVGKSLTERRPSMATPGTIIEYSCPKTEATRAAVFAKAGRKLMTIIPFTGGKVVTMTITPDRIRRTIPVSKTEFMAWTTALRKQGADFGITKGAKKALTQARKECQNGKNT